MSLSQEPYITEEQGNKAALLYSLRDEQRSSRRWQDLLSPEDRRAMLAQIARVALAVGRDLYPSQDLDDLDIGAAQSKSDVCPRERLAFLVTAWSRLAHVLQIIETAPAVALVPGLREAKIEQGSLKRATPSAVLAAVRSGDLFPVASGGSLLARRLGGRLPRRIAETVATPTTDTPINRAVKAILGQIARDLGQIAALAQATESPNVAREAETLREIVRRRLRRDPWQNLPPVPVRNVYPPASAPAYRYLFDQWRRYRGSFAFDWTNPLFTLPPRETWLLYEYSCLFTVAGALRDLGFRTLSADNFAMSRSGLTFTLEKGHTSRLVFHRKGGPRVTLFYNSNFPRTEAEDNHGWRSRSHSLRPDIVLEADGRLLIFDAKFKTYAEPSTAGDDERQNTWQFRDGALLPDLQQMHTYRDAIVRDGQGNVVSEAWLLYAGHRHLPNPEIVSYPRPTSAQPFGTGRVGALLIRPVMEPECLRNFLRWFLVRQTG